MKHRNLWKRTISIGLVGAMLAQGMALTALAAPAEGTHDPAATEEQPLYPYQDTSLSFEERAADLVSRMTLEEKAAQLQDGRNPNAPAIPRLGVQEYRWWSEALHGVARNGTATSFPTGLGIAATWDTDLVEQMMKATSDEVRDKYNDDEQSEPFGLAQWSPTINMARDPRWGRAEESYGEDQYLTGQIAEAFIDGLQGANEEGGDTYLKTMATPKHFLGNNSESNRHNGSANIDERDLREYYTYAFKNAIENGKAESIMTSYNAVNGVPMSVNLPILEDILRRTWGFDGYVTTDCDTLSDVISGHGWRPTDADWDTGVENWDGTSWGGKEATAYALKAGVDANCGTTVANNVIAAIDAGLLTEDDVDKTLVRLFTARMKTGEFDPDGGPFADIDNVVHSEENQALAEKSSDNAVVLLKNEGILPLGTTGTINSLVLVGPRADELELGDYSTYEPQHTSTALEGIQAAYERYCAEQGIEGSFQYIPGASSTSSGNYLMNIGALTLHDGEGAQVGELQWSDSSEQNGCEVEGGGNLGYMSKGDTWVKFDNVDFTNVKTVKVNMAGDTNAARTTMEIRVGSPTGQLLGSTTAGIGNTGGWQSYQTYEFEFTGAGGGYDGPQSDVYFVFKETVATGSGFTEEEQAAIEAADAVVFFAGTKQGENGYFENTDGYNLNLPGGQTEMIQSVAGLNANTVVYIQAVSQINIEPFKDSVKGIFWSTYNGQAQGNAAGRLLFGEANPSAKLPFSWYTDINDLADVQDYQIRADEENNGRTYQYFTGDVTYPFGYGLSYSTFEYSNLTIDKDGVTPDDTITVEFDVTNTSGVDGQEVAELYVVSPDAAANDRPAKRLKGFDKQEIPAGETVHFSIELAVEDLWYWDADNDIQTYDQGTYTIQVGSDSDSCEALTADFNLSGSLTKHLHAATAMPSGHILDTAKPDKTITTDLSASYNDQTFVDLESATVTYTSSKPNVAAVDENGVVTAVGGGVTTITATVQVGDETVTDTYPVVVLENIAATGITVDGAALPGFAPDVTEYTVMVSSFEQMPVVAATSTEGVDVQVEQATAEHPTATITLTKGEVKMTYTVTFYMELQSFDFTTATQEELNSTWSVVRENSDKWTLDENGLTIGTEYGDLYMNYTNNAKNLFYQEAPGDWEVQTEIELDQLPSQNYQQVSLIAYQDDDNYLKVNYQGNNSGKKAVEINVESGGQFQDQAPFSQSLEATHLWLRLKKSGDSYTGSYSTDGVVFTELGTIDWNLKNVKIVLTANNGTGQDAGEIKAAFKNFTVLSSGETYDFKGLEELPAGWSVFNPIADGLTMGEDGAVIHTTYQDGPDKVENQLCLDTPLNGDWMAETHITLSRPLQSKYEKVGMFFVKDNSNWLMLDQEQGGDERIQVYWTRNGSTIHESSSLNVDDLTDVYYRLKKVGNDFEFYYSLDGEQWTYIATEPNVDTLDGGKLMIFATSQSQSNASFDATVEYCKITKGLGAQQQWRVLVEDSDCCDVTYSAVPESIVEGVVSDGSTVTFTITPKEGKVISARTINVEGTSGQVTKTADNDGVWTVTVPQVKSDITLSVTESFGATGITFDGRSLKGFDTDKVEYVANVTELPAKVEATASEGASVEIQQPTEEDPVAIVTVSKDGQSVVYKVTFEITPETDQMTNPYLPLWEHIADGEPHVFEDPDNPGEYRVYIYGSHDSNRTSYCGKEYVTWSAPVDDLSTWRYDGVIYSCADNGAGASTLFAPDVVYKDGTYYLYVHDWGHSQTIRVATSDRPDGPFTFKNEGGHDGALVYDPEHTSGDTRVDFDPAVLVDDDGRAYLYWGGYQRTGFGSGELNEDMMTIKEGTRTESNMTNSDGGNHATGEPFYFYEGPSIRKVDDMYVLVYCQMAPAGSDEGVIHGNYRARLAYAYSENPLGPWTYGGVIIDNGGELLDDGTLSYQDGNNHGGIAEINGQWYVFYHRMTKGNEYARQSLLEPIDVQVVEENGEKKVVIPEVEMTSQGANTDGLDAYRQQDAGIACYLTGGAYITTGYRENPEYNPIVNLKDGCVAGYKYLNFGEGAAEGMYMQVEMELQPKGEAGTIDIYIDKPNADEGTLIGSIPVAAGAGEYQTVQAAVENVTGTHAVYFVFRSEGSGEICEINKFQFTNDNDGSEVGSIILSQNALTMQPGETAQLTAKVLPETAEDKTVTWSTGDPAVATVSEDGLVTAVADGLTTITAQAGGKTATCTVKVKTVTGLTSFDFTTAADKDAVLAVWDVIRENGEKWSVDENGLTIKTEEGDLYTSTNTAKNMFYQEADGDWLVETAITLNKVPAESYQQVAILAYQDDDNYLKVGYQGNSSSTTKVEINSEQNGSFADATASVEFSGTAIWFRLQKQGDTYTAWYSADGQEFMELGSKEMSLKDVKLVLTANNGTRAASEVEATFQYLNLIETEIPVESVTLDKESLTLKEGESAQLTATVLPEDATDQMVIWSSSDNGVATVDGTGKVTAVSAGTATITAATSNGVSDTCAVTVEKKDQGGGSSGGGGSSVTRYTITATATAGGSISPNGSVRVERSDDQTFTMKAQEGYELSDVLVDGKSVGAVERYTFEDVRKPHTIRAVFEKTIDEGETPLGDLPFTDVAQNAWYREAVAYVYGEGLMNGVSDTRFAPEQKLSRAMVAQILYNLAEGTPGTGAGFQDVPEGQWYTDAVNWAAREGLMDGYGDGRFGPDDSITREQLASILYRYAAYCQYDVKASGDLSAFTDGAQASQWAVEGLVWAVDRGLMTGKGGGTLDPKGTATRAEVAQVFRSFLENCAEGK